MDLVDDATSTTWAQLGGQETIWAVADALRQWIERNGVPLALYVDWKNLNEPGATSKGRLRREEPIAHFGSMCAKLGIEVIAASSSQAKGQVERGQGTHQGRLVKELLHQSISCPNQANAYMEAEYLPEHRRRFARHAAKPEDYHRRAPRAAEPGRIFRLESEGTISEDWVVRYDNRFFQWQPQSRRYALAQSKVQVCEVREGNVAIKYRGRGLPWREIPPPARPRASQATRVVEREGRRVAAGSCGGKRK